MQGELQKQTITDPYLRNSILGAARFAGIAAVLSIAGTVVAAVTSFSKPKQTVAKEGFGEGASFSFDGSSVVSIIISLAINGLLFYHLFRFSKVAGSSIQNEQGFLLTSGLTSLASYFRILSILLIFLAFFLVAAFLGFALK